MRRLLLPLICFLFSSTAFASMTDQQYMAAMAGMHAHDTPSPSPVAVEKPAKPVTGSRVAYGQIGDRPIYGYLTRPAGAKGPLPGIIVVHEWWGLNDNIRRTADRFAGEGYEVLAVDLYGGDSAQTAEEARALVTRVYNDKTRAQANLAYAYQYLKDHEHTARTGVVGWCFGGGWALQAALLLPDKLDAAVMYYGQPETDVSKLATLKMPLLGLFGEKDQGITVADVQEFEKALKTAKVDAEIHEYPGAGHAFANPSGDNYQPEAAKDAWERTLKFFKAHLQAQ